MYLIFLPDKTEFGDMEFFRNLVVLELANVLAGPAVGMFFAELGARVVKIENPATGGDVTRSWKLSGEAADSDIPSYFTAVNWGKESLALDVRQQAAKRIIHRLVERTDVIISSYKPGDDAKLGLDYETLSAINPRLIYGQITGYGRTDPRAGYDAILQAASGFTYMNGTPDGPPVKMPVALIDVLAAHQLKEGLLLALLERQAGGRGRFVHVSLLKSGVASLANQAANWLVGGHIPQRMGSEHPNIVPYGSIFATADGGQILLGVGSDAQFRQLCEVLGCPEIAADPRFVKNAGRVVNRGALSQILRENIAKWERDTLLAELDKRKVPAGGILTMPDVFRQPSAQELLLIGATPENSMLRGVRTIAFEGLDQRETLTPPPHLNADAHKILTELAGFSAAEAAAFVKNSER